MIKLKLTSGSFCRPGFIARRLCPDLVFVKADFSKYSKASSEVRAVFRDYDPDLDAASLDEAYMDVTDYCRSHEKSGTSNQDFMTAESIGPIIPTPLRDHIATKNLSISANHVSSE